MTIQTVYHDSFYTLKGLYFVTLILKNVTLYKGYKMLHNNI